MLVRIAVVALVTLASATVLAQPGPALAPPGMASAEPLPVAPAHLESEWYGWQILAADGAVFTLAAASKDGGIAFAWIGSGPTVHAAHGHLGRAVASGVLRVGLPLIGLSVGAAQAQGCTGDLCGLGDALLGGLVGMGAAEVVDLALATDEHEVAPLGSSRSWTPMASVRHSGATFGIAARF